LVSVLEKWNGICMWVWFSRLWVSFRAGENGLSGILTFCKRFNKAGKVTQFRYFFRFESLEKNFEKPLTNRSEWCIIIYVAERCDAEKK